MNSFPPWATVIIPIKDEKDNLVPLTEQLLKFLRSQIKSQTQAFEILYINDGSSDGSANLLDHLAAQYGEVEVIHFDRNYGQTSAFDAGFRAALGELLITMDGDLQFDPSDMQKLLPLIPKYDLVCGWRKDRKDSIVRKVSSRSAYFLRRFIIGDRIHDAGCSFKVFKKEVAACMPAQEGMHRFYPSLASMQGFAVTEVPVQHFPRVHGRAKYGVKNRIFKVFIDIFALWKMKRRFLNDRVHS